MVQERIYSYYERNQQLHLLFISDKMKINYTEQGVDACNNKDVVHLFIEDIDSHID